MKLRIAAILAVVVLAGAIGAWWWVGNDAQDARAVPADGTKLPPGIQREGSAPSPPAALPSSITESPPNPTRLPRPATPSVRQPGSLPGSSGPATRPPRATPPIPAAAPVAPPPLNAPQVIPPSPEESEKAAIDVEQVGFMLRDYRTRMGENPVGTNADIMKSVMGGNPKQARLGPPEGQTVNANGELVDRWGTAYFFHQLSKTDMEVRSAGPDRKMWTDDDVVGR